MNSRSKPRPANLIEELQNALTHGTVARRVETLRRVTDLFMHGANDYSDEQIEVFDDVFNCLIDEIETSARSLLSSRLAPVPKAPPRLMYTLAFDDEIEVAAPVLSHSERLNDDMLIENARCKSQGHLLAISKRKVLSNAVTDVLVERGNNEVVESAVNNPGAEFSDKGFTEIVSRAEGNDQLAICLGTRRGIPRPHYLKLIARASDSVRARLQAANPQAADDISAAVKEAAFNAGQDGGKAANAQRLVKSLFEDGRLDERQIAEFATAGRVEETTAALAICANIPVATVEHMMMEEQSEGLMVLAKVAGLSWMSLRLILEMGAGGSSAAAGNIDGHKASYDMLRPSTAQQVLRFYRMRQDTAQTEPA